MGYHTRRYALLLISGGAARRVDVMTRILFSVALTLTMLTAPAAKAACFADYKAKQDDPLRLHYGVMAVDAAPCAPSAAIEANVANRLDAAGWTLLQVEGVFDDSALEDKKADAGEFFLRF